MTSLVTASAEEKQGTDEELLTFTHFAQYFAQRAQAKHAESASLAEKLLQQQVIRSVVSKSASPNTHSMSSDTLLALQVVVQQQTQEVDNAETAALVAIDDREEAVRKLNVAQRHLEDAKGKQQHSLQVTTNSAVSPEVRQHGKRKLCQ